MTRFRSSAVLLAGSILLSPMFAVAVPSAAAQVAATRSLTGTVVDKSGAKVKGAVVHLKDTRALTQRTFITAEDGQFRFAQLSTSTDYEIWADLNGQKTDTKNLSSFDTKKVQDFTLKMQ